MIEFCVKNQDDRIRQGVSTVIVQFPTAFSIPVPSTPPYVNGAESVGASCSVHSIWSFAEDTKYHIPVTFTDISLNATFFLIARRGYVVPTVANTMPVVPVLILPLYHSSLILPSVDTCEHTATKLPVPVLLLISYLIGWFGDKMNISLAVPE